MTHSLVYQLAPKLHTTFVGLNVAKNVAQFRGIKFGQLNTRWSDPILVTSYTPANSSSRLSLTPGSTYDATKYGPIAPQPFEDVNGYYGVPNDIQVPMPFSAFQDEFHALNLTITKPSCANKLPVAIFIHGGSNTTGSAANHLYNPTRLVSRSVDIGLPIIVVSLQYRLGSLGFLCVNGKGNWGLKDQKVGIEWVKRNIQDFGGDPSNISVFGLSAGSCNVYYQAIHDIKKAKFNRVALMSGVGQTMPLLSVKSQQAVTEKLYVSVYNESPTDLDSPHVIENLKNIPVQELIKFDAGDSGIRIWYGTDDGTFVPPNTNLYNPEILCDSGIESLLISDTKNEGLLIEEFVKNIDPTNIKATLLKTPVGKDILKSYGVDTTACETKIRHAVMDLYADFVFSYPVESVFSALSKYKNVYRICFDAYNPFNPKFLAQHGVDMLYLFGSYIHAFHGQTIADKEKIISLSLSIQDTYIKFFNGSYPWCTKKVDLVESKNNSSILHVSHMFETRVLPNSEKLSSDIRNVDQFELFNRVDVSEIGKAVKKLLKL